MRFALCLFKYFPFGGLQRDFMKVCQECLRRGYEVDVYTISWEGDFPKGLRIHPVPVLGLANHSRYSSFSNRVKQRINSGCYNAVLGFNKMHGLDLYYAADVCFAATALRRSFVYRMTGRCRTKLRLERAVFGQDSRTHILSISNREKALFMKYYGTPEERFYDVPPGIEGDRRRPEGYHKVRADFREEMKIRQDEKVVLLIGSNYKLKGVDRALRAVASLTPNLRRNTRLLVVGRGKIRPMLLLARRLGVEENVRFMGPREDIPRFLFSADLLLHPSYHESGGIVVLEAIAAGLPALVSDTCGFSHHIELAGSGIRVGSPFDQTDLNEKLSFMLQSKESFSWRRGALEYAEKTDLFSMPKKTVDILERLNR